MVVTTIVPLTSITQNLLAGVADVKTILPAAAEPHEVVLSTRELQILQDADLILTWGLGLDDWATRATAATESRAPKLVATTYLNLPAGTDDPHAWLSPQRMLQIVSGLEAGLVRQFPDERERIYANTIEYREKMARLNSDFHSLAELPNRDIVTLHDAFNYLALDYNLRIVATIRDLPEDNPSPADIARVITILKKYPNAALFGESEIHPAILETIARDTGRTVYTLDPLEIADAQPDTYLATMEKNLASLQQALRNAQ